jgi:hypothetical protein
MTIQARTETDYLIISNKEKVKDLVSNSELDENDIVDIFISLHIVLEVGLNTLFRHISLAGIKKNVDTFAIIENLDKISFIDKVTMFIYNSNFNFNGQEDKANEYHKIIGKLKNFSEMRNRLLHGHSISKIFDGDKNRRSPLKKQITLENLDRQIKAFAYILEGTRFYLDCLDGSLTPEGKRSFGDNYLDSNFIPHLRTI